jgi:hypothetical protein
MIFSNKFDLFWTTIIFLYTLCVLHHKVHNQLGSLPYSQISARPNKLVRNKQPTLFYLIICNKDKSF